MLFDEIDREYLGPAQYAEPAYHFLNRSARATSTEVRRILEEWFSRYPIEHRQDLVGRFQSSDDRSHSAAFFELFLHEFSIRSWCEVVVHPDLDTGADSRPDFLITSPMGSTFVLEAAAVTGKSDAEIASERRMNQIYDALNDLDSPFFFIHLDISGTSLSQPQIGEVKKAVQRWLNSLNADEFPDPRDPAIDWKGSLFVLEDENWKIEFTASLKSPNAKALPGIRPIGVQVFDAVLGTGSADIRDKLKDKHPSQYGDFNHPYVIAIDLLNEYHDAPEDVLDALYGDVSVKIPVTPSGPGKSIQARTEDRFWRPKKNKRVSAVLAFERLYPWNIPIASVCLYHNPWAKFPVESVLNKFPEAIVKDGQIRFSKGVTVGAIMGLSTTWPRQPKE